MPDPQTTTVLNPGVGGDTMDEVQAYEDNSQGVPTAVGKRPVVALGGGTAKRDAIIEPVMDPSTGLYSLPTQDQELRNLLAAILDTNMRILERLDALTDAALGK